MSMVKTTNGQFDMPKKEIRLLILAGVVLSLALVALVVAFFPINPGKSLYFYASSGFRMPQDARVIAHAMDYGGPYSNEGELYWVFKVDAQTTASYLSASPWKNVQWRKGPIPAGLGYRWSNIDQDFDRLQSSRVWYLVESLEPMMPFYDGRIMIVDPRDNMVYFCDWNH